MRLSTIPIHCLCRAVDELNVFWIQPFHGMQNLSNLGGAINPVMCGFLLSYASPPVMFIALIAASAGALVFFWMGHRLAARTA